MKKRKKSILFPCLFIITGFLIGIISVELLVRVFNHFFPFVNTKFWVSHKFYGIKYVPNKEGYYVRPEYKTFFKINSAGWRDAEHQKEKPTNTFRILILGDSFVESFQVPLEKTAFKVLEKQLNKTSSGHQFEVIAMGIGGSSPTQQYFALIQEGLSYNPDLIVQMFCTQNDIVGNSKTLDYSPFRPYFKMENSNLEFIPREIGRDELDQKTKPVFVFFRERSLLWNFISDILSLIREKKLKMNFIKSNLGYPQDYQVYKQEYNHEWREAWELTKNILLETKNATEAAGAKYLLVSLVNIEQVKGDYWNQIRETYPKIKSENFEFEKPEKLLKDFTAKNNIPYLALLPVFKEFLSKYPHLPLFYWRDAHWNENGYQLAGKSIAKFLVGSNLVTP